MRPLTDDDPKPLLPVAGKPLIQHTVESLPPVDEVVVVAGYKEEKVREHFDGTGVTVVEQEEPRGTADAALQAREHVDGKTLILNGDDFYRLPEEVVDVETGIVYSRVENPGNYGVLELSDGELESITEKPDDPASRKVNTGCYIVQPDFFSLLEDVEESDRGEYEITDAVREYASQRRFQAVEAEEWLPCSYPWQLLEANHRLLEDLEKQVEGDVAGSASLDGEVVVEQGAEIRENTVVEGPALVKAGATVGPGAYVRGGTVLHEDVHVGKSEVKNSVIGPGSNLPHFNYVGDSYVSRDVNLGAGTKVANKRNDGDTVKVEVKGEYVDTGREKIGAFIAPGVKTGVNCSVNPGTTVGRDVKTDSGEKLKGSIPEGAVVKNGDTV